MRTRDKSYKNKTGCIHKTQLLLQFFRIVAQSTHKELQIMDALVLPIEQH
jgi:hypothetical protein